jgi:hypothetical protein
MRQIRTNLIASAAALAFGCGGGQLEISKYENGTLTEDWLIFDTMGFAGQLGLLGS